MHIRAAQPVQAVQTASKAESTIERFALQASIAVLATAFVAACAHIALPLPFSPVPLTLQTFAVLLVGLTFGPAMGGATLALYLAEGVCGFPVFAPTGVGGLAQLMGPTGGYLLAYPLAAACAGYVALKLAAVMPRMGANILGGVCAIAVTLSMGASWLAVETHATVAHVAMMGVVPFLPGEAIKILAAAGIASAWLRLRKQSA